MLLKVNVRPYLSASVSSPSNERCRMIIRALSSLQVGKFNNIACNCRLCYSFSAPAPLKWLVLTQTRFACLWRMFWGQWRIQNSLRFRYMKRRTRGFIFLLMNGSAASVTHSRDKQRLLCFMSATSLSFVSSASCWDVRWQRKVPPYNRCTHTELKATDSTWTKK